MALLFRFQIYFYKHGHDHCSSWHRNKHELIKKCTALNWVKNLFERHSDIQRNVKVKYAGPKKMREKK